MKPGDMVLVRGNFPGRLSKGTTQPMIGIIIGSENYDGEPGVGMWWVLISDGKLVLKIGFVFGEYLGGCRNLGYWCRIRIMKITREEFETVAKFLHIMKKHDPGGEQWNVTYTKEIHHNPNDLSFNRFVYINGDMVELGEK